MSHCKNCGQKVISALTPTGVVVALDAQLSLEGPWRLKRGPDGMAFALKDPKGQGERYTLHTGSSCRGVTVGGAAFR
jgi:hypothetical protein